MSEQARANHAYGALTEGVHIAGYSVERACGNLEWLLEGDRWKTVGTGFEDVNLFLDSVRLDSFRVAVESRKRIAQRIKELQPDAHNTRIAKALGVGSSTIDRDVAPDGESVNKKPCKTSADNRADSPNGEALSGAAAAKLVQRRENVGAARDERLANIAEISKGNTELSIAARYPIIYADPPWRYENPPIGGGNRSIENHYPTMSLDEICALPVAELATDDALLYLWATAPKLAECIDVIRAWGFEYRTNAVWDKQVIGMGYHFRNQHELLLVAKRGEIPPPLAGTQPSSMYREQRGEHSAKPIFFYEMIEVAYPTLPKIELFSRSPREGWAAWGNQAIAA